MKRIKSALMAAVLLIFTVSSALAYTAEDAYEEFKAAYPEFISGLNSQNITDDLMVLFLYDVQSYMKELNAVEKITTENFESNAINAINAVSARNQYLVLQDALILLYPNAIKQAILYGEVSPEFVPLVNTIKSIVFENNMLEDEKNTSSGISSGTGSGSSDNYKIIVKIKNLSETVTVSDSYKLPEELIGVTATGRELSVSVSWTGTVNVSKPGTYSVHGVITLPVGYEFDDDMTNGIDYTVIVTEKISTSKFTDINSTHWAYEAVSYLAENFILNGYLDGAFRPENNITRAEFAKIVVSAMNKFDYAAKADFTDVSEDSWYYPYVASAMNAGYILGYPDGSFAPEANITRADICTIVYRCMEASMNNSTSAFSDDGAIPPYAKEAVYALANKGIINGMGNNMFCPLEYATRAQTAKIIHSAFFKKG